MWQRPFAGIGKRGASRLHPDLNSNSSLFFIENRDIQYAAYSNDAIFPARDLHPYSLQEQQRWLDLGLPRKILGCSDENYLWDKRSGLEWYQRGEILQDKQSDHWWNITSPILEGSKRLPYDHKSLSALRLLGLAQRSSDSASAVVFLRFQWLDAAARIVRGRLSLPLDPCQWQLESHKIFNISLVRMQIVTVNMAQGRSGGELPPHEGVFDLLNGSLVDPCGLLRIRADGMKNISVSGLTGMLGLALGIWFLTIETRDNIMLIRIFRGLVQPMILSVRGDFYYIWNRAFPRSWSLL